VNGRKIEACFVGIGIEKKKPRFRRSVKGKRTSVL